MRPKSYIGITGFMSRPEVAAVFNALRTQSAMVFMVGVLVSDKSLRGEPGNPKRYPMPKELGHIFSSRQDQLNLLHINVREAVNPDQLLNNLYTARDLAGPNCHGFQLNIPWPDVTVVSRYKARYPKDKLVLQCGAGALESAGNNPHRLALLAADYEGLADYILVDPSGGRGQPFRYNTALGYLSELQHVLPDVGLGIAGGLHKGETQGHFARLLRPLKNSLSCDVESGVRDQHDNLSVELARAYAQKMSDLYHTAKFAA